MEKLDEDLYRGAQRVGTQMLRVYGGQVAAQALAAAQATVGEELGVHSLHLYFILGGDTSIPIIYDVERVRDGRSFATRRVTARQHGETIFAMTASFQRHEEGWDHQDAMPDVPGPEGGTDLAKLFEAAHPGAADYWNREWSSMSMRYVGDSRSDDDPGRQQHPAVQRLWFKTREAIGDDLRLHNAVLTYVSDVSLLGASLVPHGILPGDPRVQMASLDHAIWFHRPFRADEWLLYDQYSPSASGGRGLSIARVFDQGGRLVATVAQEGLIRPARVER